MSLRTSLQTNWKRLDKIVYCATNENQILRIGRCCECCFEVYQAPFSRRQISFADLIEELKNNYDVKFENIPNELYYYFPSILRKYCESADQAQKYSR